MEDNTLKCITAIANIVHIVFTPAVFFYVVFSFKKTLKESFRNSIRIAASEYLGELEKLRLKPLESENEDSNQHPNIDSNLFGDIISLQKRLELLLSKKKKYKNIIKLTEKLKQRAENGELFGKGYAEDEKAFTDNILTI